MRETFILGAVAYDPKVVTIWDGFARYFSERGFAFDYVLFTNYERQVEAHFDGVIDAAWNSPLAWIQTERIARKVGRTARAVAMRDTDRDLASVIAVNAASGIESIGDLRGKRVAAGAMDSPQATLIPLHHIADSGLEPGRDFELVAFDVLVGKHGDHLGGERDAARALARGDVDAACMLDVNHLLFLQERTLAPAATRVLGRTPLYDHCNFTVLDNAPEAATGRFVELLLEMRYSDPAVRPLLDLEGLKAWLPGRTESYAALEGAATRFGTIDGFVSRVAAECG